MIAPLPKCDSGEKTLRNNFSWSTHSYCVWSCIQNRILSAGQWECQFPELDPGSGVLQDVHVWKDAQKLDADAGDLIRQLLQDVHLLACLLIYKSSSPHFPSVSPSSLSERSVVDLPPLPSLSGDLSAWLQETAKSRFKRKETVESETQGSYCVEWVWWRLLKGHPFLPPFPPSAFCPHPRLLLILLGGYIGRKKEIIIMNGCVPWHMNNSFLSRESGIKMRGFKSH